MGDIIDGFEDLVEVYVGVYQGESLDNIGDVNARSVFYTSGTYYAYNGTYVGTVYDDMVSLEIGDSAAFADAVRSRLGDMIFGVRFNHSETQGTETATYIGVRMDAIELDIEDRFYFTATMAIRRYTKHPGQSGTYTDTDLGSLRVVVYYADIDKAGLIFRLGETSGTSWLALGLGFKNSSENITVCGDNAIRIFTQEHLTTTYGIDFDQMQEPIRESKAFGLPSTMEGYGLTVKGKTRQGSFDNSSDVITHSGKPLIGVTTAGFINVYKITQRQLDDLGAKLFPNFETVTGIDTSNYDVKDMLVLFSKLIFGSGLAGVLPAIDVNIPLLDILINGKLIDYIIDCHVIPCSISGASVEGLRVGYRQFNDIQVARATEDYVEVDCGSLTIPEYWANFLDYSEGTRAKLYLPFYGFVEIENEFWNGGTLSVKYLINVVDGSFQALVYSSSAVSEMRSTLIGQYGGVCCVHYPISGLQYANVISGLINGVAGVAASAAGGQIGGVVSNLENISALRPQMQSSNGYNASNSYLSHRKPYLLIERGVSQFSERYPAEMGLPLNVAMPLSQVSGFTICDDPIISFDCLEEEAEELKKLLKSGVIL